MIGPVFNKEHFDNEIFEMRQVSLSWACKLLKENAFFFFWKYYRPSKRRPKAKLMGGYRGKPSWRQSLNNITKLILLKFFFFCLVNRCRWRYICTALISLHFGYIKGMFANERKWLRLPLLVAIVSLSGIHGCVYIMTIIKTLASRRSR